MEDMGSFYHFEVYEVVRSIKYLRVQSVLQHLKTSETSHTSKTFELQKPLNLRFPQHHRQHRHSHIQAIFHLTEICGTWIIIELRRNLTHAR